MTLEYRTIREGHTNKLCIEMHCNLHVTYKNSFDELAFFTADIFAIFGALPLSRLRAYTLQDATFYTCSYLYTGDLPFQLLKVVTHNVLIALNSFTRTDSTPKMADFGLVRKAK